MATISSAGIGSGLDVNSLVEQLVAAERMPVENRLGLKETELRAELSAYGLFKSALSSFKSALRGLKLSSTFQARTATSGNTDVFAATAVSTAMAGSYNIKVNELAQAHSLASTAKTSVTDAVGTGTITLRFGTWAYDPETGAPTGFTQNGDKAERTITIDSSNNSLKGIRDAINAADAGVVAAIVNDGTGYRLTLASEDTGAVNAMEITVASADSLDSFLSYNMAAQNMTGTVQGTNARLEVNGLAVTSETNTLTEVIEGVTLSLKSTSDAPVKLDVMQDRESVAGAVSDFVTQYNKLVGTISSISGYNAETRTASILQGDSAVRLISSRIRQEVMSAMTGLAGPFTILADIGITTQLDGTLALDSTVFQAALNDHFDDVAGLFAAHGTASDSLVRYSSATGATQAGTYDVYVDQLATQGSFAGDESNNITAVTLDAANNTFALKVDGVESGTIALAAGDYNDDAALAALAAQMQSKINGDSALSAAGVSVVVSYDTVNDKFVITSDRYGSASKVEITAANSALGLDANGVRTDGQDVAGNINGAAATGSGQYLIGATGNDAEGLRLQVLGGAAPGGRGTVAFSRGIADRLDALLTGWLESDGILDSRTDGISDSLADIAERREVLDRRMVALEIRYRTQFTALDTLLSQMQSTSNFLTQQLASLPGAWKPKA